MGRYFVGSKVPEEAGNSLLRLIDFLFPKVQVKRWYGKEQFHITTNFLGELDAEELRFAVQALDQIVPRHRTFKLQLEKAGAFPRAKVIWCGVNESEQLTSLQRELRTGLQLIGAEKFQRSLYIPHITLARTGQLDNYTSLNINLQDIGASAEWTVEQLCLFESVLDPGGAKYPIVHQVRLPEAD